MNNITMLSLKGKEIQLLHLAHPSDVGEMLLSIRGMSKTDIFDEQIHDPLQLPDIEKVLHRIQQAREKRERVMIFGDYDVDGISSTAALFLFLRDELGIDVSYRLPHRVHDGYGIKKYHIDEIASTGAKLIITVDCGIRDIVPVEYAKTLGIDVIVTDHHTCPEVLPSCIAVINPKRTDSQYPFTGLSGSGVVWKLIHALSLHFFPKRVEQILQKYVDIVSLGTVADCMPMIGENRTIVRRGILQSQNSHHPFFQTFIDTLDRPIRTEEDIGFFIGPLLNAGGRLTTPYQSLSTLLASSLEAFAKIQELISVNELRKGKSRDACIGALERIDMDQPFLVVINPSLEHGILGIVAAKLTEQFHKPSAVFTLHNGNYVGSLRAPIDIDLMKILDPVSDLFLHYGGHAGAAGCTIFAEKIVEAQVRFSQAYVTLYGTEVSVPTLRVDSVLDTRGITLELLQSIETLRPFGQGFPSPVFMLQDIQIIPQILGQSGEHLRWETGNGLDIVGFHLAQFRDALSSGPVDLIGTLKSHTWRDVTRPQFQVMDAMKK